MRNRYHLPELCLFLSVAFSPAIVVAQAGPDTILFPNGDKLSGHFLNATDMSMKFTTDALGEITVDWSKIKELRTSGKVAVILKGHKIPKRLAADTIPQGTLTVENQRALVAAPPQPPQSISLESTRAMVDQPSFEEAVEHAPNILHDWTGAVTVGATLVEATQHNRTFTGAINLVRAEPAEAWLSPRTRTIFDFSASYGDLSQPHTPTVRTSIFHGDVEEDRYFDHNLFLFGRGDFDHNFSQGLTLEQTYSGGIGWTAIQTANEELDLKAGVSYLRQQFQAGPDQDLIGSLFAEHFRRAFKRGLVLDQRLAFTPAWNNTSAYSAVFLALATMPISKRISASTGVIDTFLNDPPSGFQKNSLQFTLGFTYLIK
jgi:Protein of unknown function, DUF481